MRPWKGVSKIEVDFDFTPDGKQIKRVFDHGDQLGMAAHKKGRVPTPVPADSPYG